MLPYPHFLDASPKYKNGDELEFCSSGRLTNVGDPEYAFAVSIPSCSVTSVNSFDGSEPAPGHCGVRFLVKKSWTQTDQNELFRTRLTGLFSESKKACFRGLCSS